MLDLKELKEKHDKAYQSNQVTRERAADDQLFYWVSQWDDNILGDSTLKYKGEFNVLRKAGRQIMADLRSNPVQIDFSPKASSREDGADLLDGLYLSADRVNTTLESYDNATGEAVVCGVGAWELYTEYESNRAGNEDQVIRRRPIYEANNNCFFDPNAKRLDKSDAFYCSILTPYTEEGYEKLVKDLTGEDKDCSAESFSQPEQSYVFPWVTGTTKSIYVSSFYYREQVKDKVFTMVDPFGQPLMLRESDLTDVMDELIDEGYEIKKTREILRWQVTKYIASGAEILNGEMGEDGERLGEVIAGENIPVVPIYGERAFVEGEEHYEGVTRLAKDPQRLRNFQMSYLADIVSRSPRPKPIFFPEQIQKYEFMYQQNGADSDYPYNLQNSKDLNGNPLPIGPVAQMPDQTIPQSLMLGLDLTRQAVEDVANPGLPQDIADTDLSGKAVVALQNRLDQQSIVYQQNLKHGKRRDGEIWASMASEVYDAPRKVTLTMADGSRKTEEIMGSIQDDETGEMVILNDLTNMEFDVFADIGPSYSSKKEQTVERLSEMAAAVAQSDPQLHKLLLLKIITLETGTNTDDIRDYANKQLILSGFKEPETEEEQAMMQQAQQAQQEPDPNMLIGQAEMLKAQNQKAKQEMDAKLTMRDQEIKLQELQTKQQGGMLSAQQVEREFSLKLDKMRQDITLDMQVEQRKAQESQVNNINTQADTMGVVLDNEAKKAELNRFRDMSQDELLRIANGG
jgi:hypothetical protein